jgi:hypothetical protein
MSPEDRRGERNNDALRGARPSAIARSIVISAIIVMEQGCGSAESLGKVASPIVYGSDDRLEYFEVASPDVRARMSNSLVAFVPKALIGEQAGRVGISAPSWGEIAGLCPGERFAEQPAAAFCTGVLVDWNLVLTAGHCVRLFALQDFAVVFGYYYAAPASLVLDAVRDPVAIVDEALDPDGVEPRLDYAWVRLSSAVGPPFGPVPIHVRLPNVSPGDPVMSISAGGGVPLKFDEGGVIRDARLPLADYFLADTDTTEGSSGGGAFDENLALLGILARGDMDFVPGPGGCRKLARQPDGSLSREQFTYAHRAVEGLCRTRAASSICRPDCGSPCAALPPASLVPSGGCALSRSAAFGAKGGSWTPWSLVGAVLGSQRRRKRKGGPPRASTGTSSWWS